MLPFVEDVLNRPSGSFGLNFAAVELEQLRNNILPHDKWLDNGVLAGSTNRGTTAVISLRRQRPAKRPLRSSLMSASESRGKSGIDAVIACLLS